MLVKRFDGLDQKEDFWSIYYETAIELKPFIRNFKVSYI